MLTQLAMAREPESRIEAQARAGMKSSCLMLRTRAVSHASVCTGK